MPKKSRIIAFLVIIIVLIAVIFLFKGDKSRDETGIIEKSKGNTVVYTDSGFSPELLTISAGDTITFENNSSRNMWVASDLHPTHGAYPVSGGCISSSFDACEGVDTGFSWSFVFTEKGTWKYHNHLDAIYGGTITVE